MRKRKLGKTGFEVAPLALGGNVFGWTADEATSFKLLDAFVDKGFSLIDTADVYSRWIPGHKGGESETIIGNWLKKSGKRSQAVIATKVGLDMGDGKKGLSSPTFCARSRTLCAVSKPTTSTSIRHTRTIPTRRLQKRWELLLSSSARAKFAPSEPPTIAARGSPSLSKSAGKRDWRATRHCSPNIISTIASGMKVTLRRYVKNTALE